MLRRYVPRYTPLHFAEHCTNTRIIVQQYYIYNDSTQIILFESLHSTIVVLMSRYKLLARFRCPGRHCWRN